MTIAELKLLVGIVLASAKAALARDGLVAANVFLKRKDQLLSTPVNAYMRDDATKDLLNEKIRSEAKRIDAEASFLVMEAWYAQHYDTGIPIPPPVEVPERREAIVVCGEARINGRVERLTAVQFFHKQGSEVVFGEQQEHKGEKDETHRFSFLS